MSRPRKLSVEQIADINQEYSTGVSMRQLGLKYGVTTHAVRYHIQRGVGVRPWAGRAALRTEASERVLLEGALNDLRAKEARLKMDLGNVSKSIRVKEKMLALLGSLEDTK